MRYLYENFPREEIPNLDAAEAPETHDITPKLKDWRDAFGGPGQRWNLEYCGNYYLLEQIDTNGRFGYNPTRTMFSKKRFSSQAEFDLWYQESMKAGLECPSGGVVLDNGHPKDIFNFVQNSLTFAQREFKGGRGAKTLICNIKIMFGFEGATWGGARADNPHAIAHLISRALYIFAVEPDIIFMQSTVDEAAGELCLSMRAYSDSMVEEMERKGVCGGHTDFCEHICDLIDFLKKPRPEQTRLPLPRLLIKNMQRLLK